MIWKKSYLKWLEPHALSEYYPNTSFYWVVDLTLAENAPFLVKNRAQRLWVRFSGPKNVPSSCTYLGPAQVMEVIIIDI